MRRIRRHDWTRLVASLAQLAHQRQLSQERHPERSREPLAATMRENLVAMTALSAQVIAHVLDYPEHRHVNFLEHRDSALHIEQCNLLRRRYDHTPRERYPLRDCKLGVSSTGRQVEHQAIQLSPFD